MPYSIQIIIFFVVSFSPTFWMNSVTHLYSTPASLFFSLFSCSLIEAILGTITSSASKWSDLGYTYTNDRLRVKRLCSGWWSLKINEKKQIFNGCEKIVRKSFLSFHDFCMNPSNNSPVWVTEKRAYYGITWYRWKSC